MTQPKWTLSEFTQALEQRLDSVQRGQVLLQDLPPAVAAWFYAGEACGRASRQTEIDQLNHQLDVLYMQTVTPKERQQEYQRRLEAHFANEHEAFFAPHVDPAPIAEIEGNDGRTRGTTRPQQQAA